MLVFVGGSRSGGGVVSASRALGVSLASCPGVSGLVVGCASGADAAVLCGWGSVRGVSGASVFAVGGASGAGFWGGVVPPVLARFAAAGGAVRWWSGGAGSLPLRVRLARFAAVSSGVGFGVVVVGSPSSRGSFRSVAVGAGLGVPFFAVPVGGFPLPSVGGRSWVPAPLPFGAELDPFLQLNNPHIDVPDIPLEELDFPHRRKSSMTKDWQHFVWITKYRKEVLYGAVAQEVHKCIRYKADDLGISLKSIAVMPDHVHVIAKLPSTVTKAQAAQGFKGYSSFVIQENYKVQMWHHKVIENLWAPKYFSASVGAGSMSKVQNYVQSQSIEEVASV